MAAAGARGRRIEMAGQDCPDAPSLANLSAARPSALAPRSRLRRLLPATVPDLVGAGRLRPDGNFRYMTVSGAGGTRAAIGRAHKTRREMAAAAVRVTRAPAPVSKLAVGLQSGGSQVHSGITAKPAPAAASDLPVRMGGTTILSETPETCGAGHLLTRRAASRETGEALPERIRRWEDRTARNGGEMENDPPPGNKRGGLTTSPERSPGAPARGGSAPLPAVCRFAAPITAPGLVYMGSPGHDPCPATGRIASGGTLIPLTTGRGPVSGCKPSPCIGPETNSGMYAKMKEDQDIDRGDILGGVSIAARGRKILKKIVAVAGGLKTLSRQLGFGGAEFVLWQIGAVM
jgi:altronate hydrolase/galactarate dehydratase